MSSALFTTVEVLDIDASSFKMNGLSRDAVFKNIDADLAMVRSQGGCLKITTSGKLAPTISIRNTEFISNLAMQGGAIYMDQINSVDIEVHSCTFSGNNAISGGVIYISEVKSISLLITDSEFIANYANTDGGVMTAFLSTGSLLEFRGANITDNLAHYGSSFNV